MSTTFATPKMFWEDKTWLLISLLVLATFVAYRPVWQAGFIWDDDDHLTANPAMSAPDGLRMIWSSLDVSRYYPLTLTTFWIGRRLWGLNPLPYHLLNIALHALNGVLVYFALRRLRVPAAWLAAMLWVLHPVNVESVAWITELKNTQSGVFFFLALLCFLRFDKKHEWRWYALAVLCGLAAMLSKPSTVVLPMILLLCAWWERGRWYREDLLRVAPFFALAYWTSARAVVEQRGQILKEATAEWTLGIADRLVLAGKAVWFYGAKLFWPVNLSFTYPRWELQPGSLLSWFPLASLIAAFFLVWARRGEPWSRAALFGCGCFVAALLPVLGFFDVFYFRYSFVADHFQYLASVGLVALSASAGSQLSRRTGIVAGSVAVITLGVLTWNQEHAYRGVETLWRDTLKKNPNCWLAHSNLGKHLADTGRPQEAVEHFEQTLRINPGYPKGHYNLGLTFVQLGRTQPAIAQFQQALQIQPNFPEAHCDLGLALMRAGAVQDAIAQYVWALQLKPEFATARYNLGIALLQIGQAHDAISQFEQALRINPDLADARGRLGFALVQEGKLREAIANLELALRIKPDYPEAQATLARLLATVPAKDGGDPVRAVTLAQHACELTGNREAAYVDTLAVSYAAAGRSNDAVAASQKAVELARSAKQTHLADQIESRLESYRNETGPPPLH